MTEFVIDVEADGPCAGMYSMVSFGVVDINDHANTFYGKTSPLQGALWLPEALAVSGHSRTEHESFPDPESEMRRFDRWLTATYPTDGYHKMWSDNPAFDWQFVNYYFHMFVGKNPFGFSARRIGDFYAGVKGDVKQQSKWKKLRDAKHTHNPVDDAMGNAQALNKIIAMTKETSK